MDGRKEFEEMYRRYYASVYKYIYEKVSHRQEAEDLTNEVFLSCLKHFKRFDSSRASAATWLFAITRNRLKNYYRDKKSMVSVDDEMFMVELADESCVDEAALLAQLRAVLAGRWTASVNGRRRSSF